MESDLSKFSILKLESLRGELIDQGFNHPSDHLRINLFFNYFDNVLMANDPNIAESFLIEFIEDYFYLIRRYEVWGIEPSFTEKLLQQLKVLRTISLTGLDKEILTSEIHRIEKQSEKLSDVLRGKPDNDQVSQKAFFPLIDKESPIGFYGVIDSLTVRINKSTENNKFIIIPSEKEIEKRISEQCNNSWLVALGTLKKYVKKPFRYHEVIISFDKKIGFYEGYSLGIALTFSFLEELLKFYNPQYIIKIREQSAFTGGVSEGGIVLDTGEDIIKQKVAAVFYSDIQSFVIPKLEETYAYSALTQLKKKYPARNLKLIPVEDINDVINRRDLVEIKKINPVIRTGKFIRKNWISALATVLLAMFFAYLFVIDFDDNPYSLELDTNKIYIKNKNGKLLWTANTRISLAMVNSPQHIAQIAKIIDINDDGENEVLIRDDNRNVILCYDQRKKEIWSHTFDDSVFSQREIMNTDYGMKILDTTTYMEEKSIYLIAANRQSFASAIYRLKAETGERLPGTFWASGHVMDGIITDFDSDDNVEIIGVGYDNGFEDFTFFAFEIDSATSVRLTTSDYLIQNYPPTKLEAYIRFPKSDVEKLNERRTPGYTISSFHNLKDKKKFHFATSLINNSNVAAIGYIIYYNLKEIDVVIGSDYRVQRDTLVAQGKLKLPFTDTNEYIELIKSKVLYYKDGEWVTRNEIK